MPSHRIQNVSVDLNVWIRFKGIIEKKYGTVYGVVAREVEAAIKDRTEKLEREHQGATPIFGAGKAA